MRNYQPIPPTFKNISPLYAVLAHQKLVHFLTDSSFSESDFAGDGAAACPTPPLNTRALDVTIFLQFLLFIHLFYILLSSEAQLLCINTSEHLLCTSAVLSAV